MDTNEIKRITTTLGNDSEKDRFYVYMLCDERIPFYIGKGQADRVWQHEYGEEEKQSEINYHINEINNAINREIGKAKGDTDVLLSLEEKRKHMITQITSDISAKYSKIKSLKEKNIKINKVIVKWGLTEEEAYMVESALMNMYYYINNTNINIENAKSIHDEKILTNIVNGHMSKKEKHNIAHETRARSIDEFLNECAIEDILITYINNSHIMLVNISKTYPDCKDLNPDEQELAIYDCSRAAWKISKDRVDKIEYVFALYNSQVVGIYRVDENSWCQRKNLPEGYDFPKYPLAIREREWKYTQALKSIKSLEEAEIFCNSTDGFNVEDMYSVIGNNFDDWKSRYCFMISSNSIPKNIADFKNKLLYFPTSNGGKRKIGQNDRYNFKIKSINGEEKIEITEVYG